MDAMRAGLLISTNDPELKAIRTRTRQLYRSFNESPAEATEERDRILHELLGSMGEGAHVKQPIVCDYGFNIHVGRNVFVNCGLVALDLGDVILEDDVLIGPNVSIYTIEHPTSPELRRLPYERGRTVRVERGAWIGGHSVINPGVTVGAGSIVGSGSVVTRDIPAGVVAVGSPCRPIRKLDARDEKTWLSAFRERLGAGLPVPELEDVLAV